MAQAVAAQAPVEESDDDVGITAQPAPAAAPSGEPPPAPGAAGRQIIVRPREPPKPPPAPIAPHEAVPVTVPPKAVAPAAPGQKPPAAPAEESDDDVGIQKWPGWGPEIGRSIQGGLAEGVEGLAGAPRDIPNLVDYGLDWAGAHVNQALGGENAKDAIERTHGSLFRQVIGDKAYNALSSANVAPSGATLQDIAKRYGLDPGYKPQSMAGRYAHEIAAFLPGAVIPGLGEAGIGARALQTIAPAIGSETLGHMAEGTAYEPWARFAGAGLGALTQTGVTKMAAPFTEGGQKDLAAADLAKRATDPDAALAKARAAQAQRQPGMATGESIPGAKPTTSQVTADPGLVGAEREYQKDYAVEHSQRWNAQSAAQTKALQDVQQGGDSTKVADVITQRLQQIDQQHAANVVAAQQSHAATERGLTARAQQEAGVVAKRGEPETLGANARKAIADSMAQAKAKEEKLWQAIDPDKKIAVPSNTIRAQARNIMRGIGKQKPPEGEEARILEESADLPKNWTKLRDVTDLTSRLKAAMREERIQHGNTPALKRMATLLKTKENTIKNAATRQSAREAEMEAQGFRRMTPQDRAQIMAARTATRARGEIERGPAGAIIRKGATADSYRTAESQVPGKVFAAGPTGYQKAKAYADATGKPWLDPFQDLVSDSLAREATTDGMIDAGKLAKWQAKYGDALRALPPNVRQKFVTTPGAAGNALAESAAQRREALIAHQKIDVAKQMGKSPAEAMRKDPALKDLEGMTSPADVQNHVAGLFSRKDAVRQLTNLRNHLLSQPGGANAAEGLKRAALDHVLERVTSMTQAGVGSGVKALKPGQTQAFIASNKAALKAAGFDNAQLRAMDQVADDIERQQSLYTTTVSKGSPTGQLVSKQLRDIAAKGHDSAGWLALLIGGKEAYHALPESLHGVVGVGAAAAAYGAHKLYTHAKQKGLASAQSIYHDAVMNPDNAADLFARSKANQARLAERYRRQAMYAGLAGERSMVLKRAQ